MDGLLKQPADAAAETPAPEAEAEPAQPEQPEGEQPNVTPEEQAAYSKFMDNALKLIYDPKTFKTVLKSLAGTRDPVDNLANTAAIIVERLTSSAKKAGAPIDPAVLMNGATEIVEDLANTAGPEHARIHDFTQEELNAADIRMKDLVRQLLIKSGAIDPEAMKQEFQGLAQADQQGKL
ncbi:MAG: hypothetical protein Q7S17_07810, partial [Xanthobacteraceae bacterium]|nr:hypothetical protein [Xanthobacteraceae bacterium]